MHSLSAIRLRAYRTDNAAKYLPDYKSVGLGDVLPFSKKGHYAGVYLLKPAAAWLGSCEYELGRVGEQVHFWRVGTDRVAQR